MSASGGRIPPHGDRGDAGGGARPGMSREARNHIHLDMLRHRYLKPATGRKERSAMLDGAEEDTQMHRGSIGRYLRRGGGPPVPRTGRPPRYGPETAGALFDLWHLLGRPEDRRLAAAAADTAKALVRSGKREYPSGVIRKLEDVSPSTVLRLLRPLRAGTARQRRSRRGRKANHAILQATPVRPSGDQGGAAPGWVQADTVHHCGATTAGEYVRTLVVADEHTSWIDAVALPRLTGAAVAGALDRVRRRAPIPMAHLQTDNGAEFQNRNVDGWAERLGIGRSRGRPRRSNDQAHVEQRNWTAVRRLVGDARYEGADAAAALDALYGPLCRLLNFFLPVRRSAGAAQRDGKSVRVYEEPLTPYRKLLAAGVLDGDAERRLTARFLRLDPEDLQERIDAALDRIERLAR